MKFCLVFLTTAIIVLCSSATFSSEKNQQKKLGKKVKLSNAKKQLHFLDKPNPYYIVIDKSDYELKVYDEEGWYATYPVVFGNKDLSDKMQQGDKKTPEGTYKVVIKKVHAEWGPELMLDYPNKTAVQLFNERKAKGVIPKSAKIGGGIAIHGTRPQSEWTIDKYYNWTDGCISVKYTEMQDLYSYISIGTQVTIQP